MYINISALGWALAFTRYCFTLRLTCTNQSSFYSPPHPHCPHYCTTSTRLLRNTRPPFDPLVYAIHHTMLVMAISCKGQAGLCSARRSSRWVALIICLPSRGTPVQTIAQRAKNGRNQQTRSNPEERHGWVRRVYNICSYTCIHTYTYVYIHIHIYIHIYLCK